MDAISKVQQDMLDRMEQLKGLSQSGPVKPAQLFASTSEASFGAAMENAVHSVNAQQLHASQMVAAVDSGQSDNLVGAMIESQKASVSFSALLQVRNKLTTAFDEIMRTPL
jgi:flagellar hook-basal body complex protein FliE